MGEKRDHLFSNGWTERNWEKEKLQIKWKYLSPALWTTNGNRQSESDCGIPLVDLIWIQIQKGWTPAVAYLESEHQFDYQNQKGPFEFVVAWDE